MSSQSHSATFNESVSSVQSNMTSLLNSTTQTATATAQIVQGITIQNEGVINCTNLNLSNVAVANVNLQSSLGSNSTASLQTMMTQAIQQSATSAATQTQQLLSTPFTSQSSKTTTNISESLQNLVSTSITDETVNSCMAAATITQNDTLVNYGIITGTNCDFGNNAIITIAVSCLLNKGLSVAATDTDLVTATQTACDTLDQENQGAAASLTSSMSGITTYLIIGGCVIGGIIVLVVIISVFGKGSSKSNSKSKSKSRKNKNDDDDD
jgi:hypothetical protein